MTPFQKNLQRSLIFFFTAVSIGIIVIGINRVKKASIVSEVPSSEPVSGESTITPLASRAGAVAFVGKTYHTPYGDTSASIEVKNGKIVAVAMPHVPDSPPSIYAKPFLIDQAIKAGGANIQGVSGATYTSLAFKSSLESAIAQAKTQGQTVAPAALDAAPAVKPSVPRQYREDDDDLFEFED